MRTAPNAFQLFLLGRNRRGNWVVQSQHGLRGGLFVSRAEALKFAHHVRKHRLRGTGAEYDQKLILDVGNETKNGEARPVGDRAEDEDHEDQTGEIEGADQLSEVGE